MCPDDAVLSSLLEGDLSPGHEEQVRAHVAACSVCRERLEKNRQALTLLESAAEPDLLTRQDYILSRIHASSRIDRFGFLKRKLALPVPAVAALAFLVMVLAGGVAFFSRHSKPVPEIAARSNSTMMTIDADDIALIKKLLEGDDLPIEVNMALPRQDEIIIIGEPEIVTERPHMRFND